MKLRSHLSRKFDENIEKGRFLKLRQTWPIFFKFCLLSPGKCQKTLENLCLLALLRPNLTKFGRETKTNIILRLIMTWSNLTMINNFWIKAFSKVKYFFHPILFMLWKFQTCYGCYFNLSIGIVHSQLNCFFKSVARGIRGRERERVKVADFWK